MTEIQGDNLVFEPPIMFGWGFVSFLTRSQVREALKPVVGQAYFAVPNFYNNGVSPIYHAIPKPFDNEGWLYFAVNALTIGKTCGKLRELWEWCNES